MEDMLDKIQMRPTKLIRGFRDLSYEEISKDVVLNGHVNIDTNIYFKIKIGKLN